MKKRKYGEKNDNFFILQKLFFIKISTENQSDNTIQLK